MAHISYNPCNGSIQYDDGGASAPPAIMISSQWDDNDLDGGVADVDDVQNPFLQPETQDNGNVLFSPFVPGAQTKKRAGNRGINEVQIRRSKLEEHEKYWGLHVKCWNVCALILSLLSLPSMAGFIYLYVTQPKSHYVVNIDTFVSLLFFPLGFSASISGVVAGCGRNAKAAKVCIILWIAFGLCFAAYEALSNVLKATMNKSLMATSIVSIILAVPLSLLVSGLCAMCAYRYRKSLVEQDKMTRSGW